MQGQKRLRSMRNGTKSRVSREPVCVLRGAGWRIFAMAVGALLMTSGVTARRLDGKNAVTGTTSSTDSTQLCGVIGGCQPTISEMLAGSFTNQPQANISASVVSPGEQLIVFGQSFLPSDGIAGQLVLNLVQGGGGTAINNPRFPSPAPPQNVSYTLTNIQWAGTAVFVSVPMNITGVMDQQATLQVVRSDGAKSNPFSVQFVAWRDIELLPASYVKANCAAGAYSNACAGGFLAPYSSSIGGEHQADIGGLSSCGQPNSPPCGPEQVFQGTDQFTFALKNGWIVIYWADLGTLDSDFYDKSSLDMVLQRGGSTSEAICPFGDPLCSDPLGVLTQSPPGPYSVPFPLAGSAGGTYSVSWTCDWLMQYQFSIFIEGPIGVPWN